MLIFKNTLNQLLEVDLTALVLRLGPYEEREVDLPDEFLNHQGVQMNVGKGLLARIKPAEPAPKVAKKKAPEPPLESPAETPVPEE